VNLYGKVIVLILALFVCGGALNYVVQRQVVLPSFEALEQDLARTDVERVSRAIDTELSQLLVFCADWGNWLETYEFMAGDNPAFIAENMTPATLEAAGLDLVGYLDADGHYLWRTGRNPDTRAERAYDLVAGDALDAAHPFRAAIAAGREVKGIQMTEHGPMLLVAAPVLDGAGNGPHRGAVLLGRLITPEVAAGWADQAQVKLTLLPVTAVAAASAAGPPGEDTSITQTRDTITVSRSIDDLRGWPAFTLRVDAPRSVTGRGRAAIAVAVTSLSLAGLAVLLVLLAALRVLVLGPVSQLTRHAVAVGEGVRPQAPLAFQRADELGVLAREFDRMVDRLEDTRRRLMDQSYEAGAAEVASGVLHNIGNGLTPLGVTISKLQQRLRAAPAAELELVLAELDAGSADHPRRADLEQFHRLASRELGRVIGQACEDADHMAGCLESIQAVLAHQLRPSTSGPLVEMIPVAPLLERAAATVPPPLRPRVNVEIDPALRELGALPLPRFTLEQVCQNLTLNGAEAIRDSGHARGTVRIEGRVERSEDGEHLVLRFTDDGIGIPPGDLERVFEKGYTTKSRDTNSGIGLHWCANVLLALSGRIRAASRGPGQGATFEIVLPLRHDVVRSRSLAA
jgi:sensor domain CHASE-containing protein